MLVRLTCKSKGLDNTDIPTLNRLHSRISIISCTSITNVSTLSYKRCKYLNKAVLYCVVSCPVLLCRAVPCRVLSCGVVSCRVLSCFVLSCRVVSCRVVSCRVVSCRSLLRYIMLCIITRMFNETFSLSAFVYCNGLVVYSMQQTDFLVSTHICYTIFL